MEVGELDLDRRRLKVRAGFDDDRHHLGVEQGAVAAEGTKDKSNVRIQTETCKNKQRCHRNESRPNCITSGKA